jgi:hypothetical protein
MKLMINNFKVRTWDAIFIAFALFLTFYNMFERQWGIAALDGLIFIMAIQAECLKSEIYHLKKK